ncbi:MAG: hypothetical protein WKF42_07870 [Solirubrobacteraceae bacterium]
MPAASRSILAAASTAGALALMASSAHAAEIKTLPCVPLLPGEQTMPIVGSAFTPGGFVTVSTNTAANPTPVTLTSSRVDPAGGFKALTAPPRFARFDDNLQSFNLIATDTTNPAAPIVATMPFQVVRFGMTRSPNPRRPTSRVTHTARGWTPGKRVYAHYRFGGKTRSTVSLGVAKGPCGITSKKMRALPTAIRRGTWRAAIDQSKRYSKSTRPQFVDSFRIFRTFG